MLANAGYELEVVENPEAVRLAVRGHGANVDLIIAGLPDSELSSESFVAVLRGAMVSPPILVLSGYSAICADVTPGLGVLWKPSRKKSYSPRRAL